MIRMIASIPATGWVGDGNSGTVGAMSSGTAVSEAVLIRFGRIERALVLCTGTERHALSLAYGDAGALVTETGRLQDRRWQAIAVLTEAARERAPAWAASHPSRGWSVERERAERERAKRRAEKETDDEKLKRMERENKQRDASLGDATARYLHTLLNVGWSDLGLEGRAALNLIERQARGLLAAAEDSYARAATRIYAGERDVRVTNAKADVEAGLTAAQRWEKGEA